jgi:23S rRNA-/tRNA-specific pseudouridylate synthase
MIRREIIVSKDEAGWRVDRLILGRCPNLSRSRCREYIAAGNVRINGTRVKKGARVGEGDRVELDEKELEGHAVDFVPAPSPGFDATVLYRDDRVLALDKPAGVDCAPLRASDSNTLLAAALNVAPALSSVRGWKKREGGLLYRLDRQVTGVVVFALTDESFDFLSRASRGDLLRKHYIAVVENLSGEPLRRHGTVTAEPFRGRGGGRKAALRNVAFHPGRTLDQVMKKFSGPGAPYATHLEPLAHAGGLSLVDIEIARALRHQIRASLGMVGHPVAGDRLYGSSLQPEEGAIMLHCRRVRLPRPAEGPPLVITSYPSRIVGFRSEFKDAGEGLP